MSLVEGVLAGDVRAVARAITLVENGAREAVEILREIFPRTGKATVLGLTGAPGAGKSSLVDRLVAEYRAAGSRVGVIAVDPSSTFSGGALLGDRVRMQAHATDPDVFIRSMATRGHLGGLARATNDAIDVLDAGGFDPVLVETVGVGQDEVDVIKTADTVAVILVPGMGDDIQAIKAGILEIADLFVINKADRPGADRLQADLDYMLSLVNDGDRARPPILRTVATEGGGIEELRSELDRRPGEGDSGRERRRRERAEARFLSVLTERLVGRVLRETLSAGVLEGLIGDIASRRRDPYSVVERLLERVEVR
jgi:LAO/AO transport system kinase